MLVIPLQAQYIEQFPISEGNAEKMFEFENYQEAVRQYRSLLKEDPNNLSYRYFLGKALTYSLIDQESGLELLEEVCLKNTLDEKLNWRKTLALAYFKNYQFDEAKKWYEKALAKYDDESLKTELMEKIKGCDAAKRLYQNPVSVSFENLGDHVNSKAPDYLPFVSTDESLIFFSTRREGVVGNLYDYKGYRTADIYTSRHRRNKYSRARSVGSPNTYGNEEMAGRSENGKYLLYHVDSEDHFSNLFVSEMGRRSYMAPKVFDSKEINQKSREPGGALTNNGERLYFSSNRDGGIGGYDIYVVNRLPNGKWGLPKNIGPPINTEKDELYPFLMDNEKTLYFSSNGFPGMGGMDLFKSTMNDENGQWSEVKNLGYPINTVNDDYSICFATNRRYAYVAQKRADSYGDLDIYRLTFNTERSEYTLLSGTILSTDSSLIKVDVLVEVINEENGELVGSYLMNKKTSKYHAILPPGRYLIQVIDTYGFEDFTKKIQLLSKNDFMESKQLNLVLKPK
jgi:hypothetical protein